jgi:hypothetical protein
MLNDRGLQRGATVEVFYLIVDWQIPAKFRRKVVAMLHNKLASKSSLLLG